MKKVVQPLIMGLAGLRKAGLTSHDSREHVPSELWWPRQGGEHSSRVNKGTHKGRCWEGVRGGLLRPGSVPGYVFARKTTKYSTEYGSPW
jgi:hypothetical protein